jgi:hypothetical protein
VKKRTPIMKQDGLYTPYTHKGLDQGLLHRPRCTGALDWASHTWR